MKKLLFLFMLPALAFSQNLVFIGENSYPSSKVLVFENKYDDVEISFIRDENTIRYKIVTSSTYENEARTAKNTKLGTYEIIKYII